MVKDVWVVVFSCFIAFKGKSVSASCPLTINPSRVVVKYGDSLSVNCSATSDQIEGMGWESDYKGTGLQNVDFLEYKTDKVDRWSIEADCFINLKNTSQCSKNLPIIVYKMPHSVSISPPNENRPMVEGSEYQVVCDIVDVAPAKNLLVTWYRDDKGVFNQSHTEPTSTPLNLSSVFKMTAHREDDQVKLMCEAKLYFGPTGPALLPMRSASLTLQVHYPPLFLKPEVEKVEVPADRKTTLDCTTKGNPTPAYHWQVPEATQPQVKNQSVLNLLEPFPGSYNCTASNSQGRSTKQFILRNAPRKSVSASCPLTITPSSVVVKYGDSFSVNCSTTSDQREGMGWESDYKSTGLQNVDFLALRIEKVDKWIIGSKCYIHLKGYSQCSKNLSIIVYKMPHSVSISPPNENRPMVEGSEYQVVCDIVDVAPAKNLLVTWYRDDKGVFNQSHIESTSTPLNLSSVFKMTADRKYDQVKLMCEAKFDFGPTGPALQPMRSASLTLQVHYPPLFLKPEVETVEVPADGKITLDCTAKGNPTPASHWHVPEATQPQVKNQSVLNLLEPFPGSYNCTASNSQGSSTKQFILRNAPRDHTVLIIMIVLAVVLLISGPFIVMKVRTFLLNKSNHSRGQPTSQPI